MRSRALIMGTIAAVGLAAATLAAAPLVRAIHSLRSTSPVATAFMARERKRPVQRWVPIASIAPALQRAVVVAEDPRFFEHHGVDAQLVFASIARNLRAGHIVRGGSTITMQLAKNLFLSPERSVWRKANEVLIAFAMEIVLPKERILELYLNAAEWGPRVYGAEVAARYHFDKPAAALTAREAATLAALLPNPKLAALKRYRRRFSLAAAMIEARLHSQRLPR